MTTVLILEDDPTSVEVLRVLLNDVGYRALEAVTPEEAIEVCIQHPAPIDLLVADVVLRHASGPAITRRLKKIRPQMAILFISGHDQAEVLNRGLLEAEEMESGESCFLQKPFTREQFKAHIKSLLAARDNSPHAIKTEREHIQQFLLEQLEQSRREYEASLEPLRREARRKYQRALQAFTHFVVRHH